MGILSGNVNVKCNGCGRVDTLECIEEGDGAFRFDAEMYDWQWTDKGLECENCCAPPEDE
ncbi:MAG TPA: hypothetical protein VF275_03155 [Gammaproteobacteria bacterium]